MNDYYIRNHSKKLSKDMLPTIGLVLEYIEKMGDVDEHKDYCDVVNQVKYKIAKRKNYYLITIVNLRT